ncbi:MAG TPA: ribosomal protein S18-alanine N-acetyltransferase [Vicinamibacterales bacterium]|jgi:[ribosomal protein S18]-alanine N-acetyltransferase|nr:ribosomal protein S18-alanine N-acetyltransferase [Vicinamibacterales bacterium]
MTANDVPDYSISRLHARDDLADVVALEAASFSNPWSRDTLERDLRNTDVVRVYVLRDGDRRLVGFCGCWFVADELHINTLAVADEFRRRGHATRLLRFVLAEAAAAGITRATLEVRRSNVAALRLYDRFDFEVRGVRRAYYTQPVEDALVLWSQKLGFLNLNTEP